MKGRAEHDENEGRQKDAQGGQQGARQPRHDGADGRRGGKYRAGCGLADGDGVQQLLRAEPAVAAHQVLLDVGHQQIAAAEKEWRRCAGNREIARLQPALR